ncbi:hypothetical protein CcCBS67573_g04670 [Chytriomyces confervae]|uniref:ZZ-type domain-containing protein n=1 Tax=Chytriomyces confervae TaxID=246404 RepID=A0A507FEP6_9FUNG|nr:hypothetical protein HDU80_002716 [Chytriomyces hyalinus]TPX74050.1 hypothetical protein CcCBS67573_g04670 [Chytriomyces confervae]
MSFWKSNDPAATPSTSPSFLLTEGNLVPFPPAVSQPTPQQLVPSQPGDDLTPPNGVDQSNVNGIALLSAASAGFSVSPPREDFHPSAIHYDVDVSAASLNVVLSLEFENPYFNNKSADSNLHESMMVKTKVAKLIAIPGSDQQLRLISTTFQDWDEVAGRWVDITADVAYTAQAEAVVQAVIETAPGQTAGLSTVKQESFDATLGPVGLKGRIVLKFSCGKPYSYDAMGMAQDGSDIGKAKIIPLALFLPWASVGDVTGLCAISFSVTVPENAHVLPAGLCGNAYEHLRSQSIFSKSAMVAVGDFKKQSNGDSKLRAGYKWDCLPPQQTFILTWISILNDPDFGFEVLDVNDVPNERPMKATIYRPSSKDQLLLTHARPGAGFISSQLMRILIEAPKMTVARTDPCLVMNISMSDSSGSTFARCDSGTVRDQFNAMLERRFLKRISSIPTLLAAGILQPNDIWADLVIVFDHSILGEKLIMFKVCDYEDGCVVQGADGSVSVGSSPISRSSATAKSIVEYVKWFKTFSASGGTDFLVPSHAAGAKYDEIMRSAKNLAGPGANLEMKAFVDFDTDGGHYGDVSSACSALEGVCKQFKVRNGIVTGFGAWVDQNCSSRMAAVLGPNPALLGLHVPEMGKEGMDSIFRRGFTAWIDAIRFESFTVSIAAGSHLYQDARVGTKSSDALEVIAAVLEKGAGALEFGAPDVSSLDVVGSVIQGVASGDSMIVYVNSALEASEVARRLELKVNGKVVGNAVRLVASETLEGDDLAFEWLALAAKETKGIVINSTVANSRVLSRLEDNVSFAYNLPAISGATSYLGRAKTSANRSPIDKDHQAAEPKTNLKKREEILLQAQPLFGGASGGAMPKLGGAFGFRKQQAHLQSPASAPFAPAQSSGFGAPASLFGAAQSSGFGAPASSFNASAPYSAFGAPAPSSSFGAPAPSSAFGAPAPSSAFGAPAPSSQYGASQPFGFGSAAAPSQQPPPPPPASFAFGSAAAPSQQPPPPPRASFAFGSAAVPNKQQQQQQQQLKVQHQAAQSALRFPIGTSIVLWSDILECSSFLCTMSSSTSKAASAGETPLETMQSLRNIRFSIDKFSNRKTSNGHPISYNCDVCSKPIDEDTGRWHCNDCEDYDECFSCHSKQGHLTSLPLHRMRNISTKSQAVLIAAPNSLVDSLLGPSPTQQQSASSSSVVVDRTAQIDVGRARRFALAMLAWWQSIRMALPNSQKLPEALDPAFTSEIRSALVLTSPEPLLAIVLKVIDTLERETA